jgi:hypothetical protein
MSLNLFRDAGPLCRFLLEMTGERYYYADRRAMTQRRRDHIRRLRIFWGRK